MAEEGVARGETDTEIGLVIEGDVGEAREPREEAVGDGRTAAIGAGATRAVGLFCAAGVAGRGRICLDEVKRLLGDPGVPGEPGVKEAEEK